MHWRQQKGGRDRLIEVSSTADYWQINRDFGKWSFNGGWLLNRGQTVLIPQSLVLRSIVFYVENSVLAYGSNRERNCKWALTTKTWTPQGNIVDKNHVHKDPGEDPHMKRLGIIAVSLRGIDDGFWSHLRCVDDETPLLLGVSFALQEIIIKETLLSPAVARLDFCQSFSRVGCTGNWAHFVLKWYLLGVK